MFESAPDKPEEADATTGEAEEISPAPPRLSLSCALVSLLASLGTRCGDSTRFSESELTTNSAGPAPTDSSISAREPFPKVSLSVTASSLPTLGVPLDEVGSSPRLTGNVTGTVAVALSKDFGDSSPSDPASRVAGGRSKVGGRSDMVSTEMSPIQ